MSMCEKGIDCKECSIRGMCDSYALFCYNKALEDMANKIKEYSGYHYHLDYDGYFGGQTELIFRTEEFLDDVLSELKI